MGADTQIVGKDVLQAIALPLDGGGLGGGDLSSCFSPMRRAHHHPSAAGAAPSLPHQGGGKEGRDAEGQFRLFIRFRGGGFRLGAPLLLLTACHVDIPDKVATAKAEAAKTAIAESEGKIDCAPPGAGHFAYVCGIDRMQTQDGLFLTLRHPDGGFRRLLVTNDGRGVIAADGAEQAQVTPLGSDLIEVALGGARYRLPATVRQKGKPS